MKKLFLLMMAVGAMTFVSCNGNAEKTSGSAAASGDKEEVAEVKGTVFEGASFTMTYPEILTKETFKSEGTINASDEEGTIKMDATFSDMPCKPEDFKTYAEGLIGLNKESKAEEPKIDGNIMTLKFVNGEDAETNYVVFLDEKGGVAGKFRYPVAKAGEVEPLIEPMLKSIKKK